MLQVRLMTQHRSSEALELQASATTFFRWFTNNQLKANPRKSHILLSTKKPKLVSIYGIPFAASSHKKLLEVTTDSELKSENHITELCPKVSKKLNACISKLAKNLTLAAVYQVPCL